MARSRFARYVDAPTRAPIADTPDDPTPISEAPEPTMITCFCGVLFEFEIGEQEFFSRMGWPAPTRCPTCRAARRAAREANR